MEVNFRIVVVPDGKHLDDGELSLFSASHILFLKTRLEECGLIDVSISLLRVPKNEEEDFIDVEELVFQVQARYPKSSNFIQDKFLVQRSFIRAWTAKFAPNPAPFLIFYENKNFIPCRLSCHRISYCNTVQFGVVPYNGQFHYVYPMSKTFSAEFYHDTREVLFRCEPFEFKFHYNNIKNIFAYSDSNTGELLLDLCNPPIINRIERRTNRYGSYTLTHRTGPALFFPSDLYGEITALRMQFDNYRVLEEIVSRIHFRCSEKPVIFAKLALTPNKPKQEFDLNLSHFGCTYLLHAIFKRNLIMAHQTEDTNASIALMKQLCSESSDRLEKALTLVLAAMDSGRIVNYWHAIERMFYQYRTNDDEINFHHYVIPEKCKLIRRLTLTPTRQLLWPAEIMLSNRVLRNFDPEYALRVSFRDDNYSRLSFVAPYADEIVFEQSIFKPMLNGLTIGNRHYEFLAWSNSQIRDHGVWMYARDTKGKTAADIRSWMGDFSHIHTVPKYMARMGQSFSQTEETVSVPLDPSHIHTVPDIERGRDVSGKAYCFSDGVGRISRGLAKKVHDALGHDKMCSAFQIRYGGYKGMLVLDPTLTDADIVFRESMKKFDSPANIRLEIAKTSAPISLQLNRPFIAILNDMGVRHRTFLRLQEDMLRKLTDMLIEEKQAAEFLESKTPSDIFNYQEMSRSGIHLTTEPFFRSLLLALHRHHVGKIKTRANIYIDPNNGRNMLGCMDETGLLQYGQVFVQYTKNINRGETSRNETVILKNRQVLVTKNPCLLPGDVRKFQAVDIPQLHHIVDLIVFPQQGHRPHCNEMAGSDFDGDEYSVVFDDDLIFHKSNEKPGDFPSESAALNYNIQVRDMISFLVEYIKNDQVGVIANAHLAHADKLGVASDRCKEIARKFSFAVDFAKTGVRKLLDKVDRPDLFPDFMEKNHKETYKSEKALGKMYRIAHDYESENENASMTYPEVKIDTDLNYPGWERFKESAIKSRNKFNSLLRTVLRNYGIQHESEVFSGAFTNLHCRFQERKDRAEIEKVVVRCIKRLAKCMREEFLEEFQNSGTNINELVDGMLQKASAWYYASYSDKDSRFLSFPWTVSEHLANIKVLKVGRLPLYSPVIDKMDTRIAECDAARLLPIASDFPSIWEHYEVCCDREIINRAQRVLLMWAQDEGLVAKPDNSGSFMYESKLVRLFLFVADQSGYIRKRNSQEHNSNVARTSASLCLEFLRFLLKLRFYNKTEILQLLPFDLFKHSKISKHAVVTFHRFALLGYLPLLYPDERQIEEDLLEMNPLYINSKVFDRTPVDAETLRKAEDTLVRFTGAKEVHLREIQQTKKICVTCRGSEKAIKDLKSILRKKQVLISYLLKYGRMPPDQ